jgi:hypothetical protein
VKAITHIDYISDEGDAQFTPTPSTAQSFLEALHHDPVAHVRALVRVVCMQIEDHHINSDICCSAEHLLFEESISVNVCLRTRRLTINYFVM